MFKMVKPICMIQLIKISKITLTVYKLYNINQSF